jgi:hypothetical protein
MKNEDLFGFLFYAAVFIAFGLGLSMGQRLEDKLADGYWFIGIGFLFFIIFIVVEKKREKKELEKELIKPTGLVNSKLM